MRKRDSLHLFKIAPFLFIIALGISVGFTPKLSDPLAIKGGTFTYMVNDKVFTLENVTAVMRNTTDGRKQLSLSNDRFVKFFFINPEIKEFDLSTTAAKQAIVRYNEPGTNNIYAPKAGKVKIENLDESSKMLSGEFDMELILPGKDKVIKVSKGKFNVPIVVLR